MPKNEQTTINNKQIKEISIQKPITEPTLSPEPSPILQHSPQTLLIQQQLNRIQINDTPLIENGLLDTDTIQAIKKLQQITNFTPNGVVDQNLTFRLNEIIENPIITEYNINKTFAVLYNQYIEESKNNNSCLTK